MSIKTRKKIKDLKNYKSPEFNDLLQWLINTIGPESTSLFSSGNERIGIGWYLGRSMLKKDKSGNFYFDWYVEFDARKLKRKQLTWFRLKWQ